jgi:Permuted papain-like amidase enzyme, YaeF/YiiX, C92 family
MAATELIAPRSLDERVAEFGARAGQAVATADDLTRLLTGMYQAILGTDLNAYDPAAVKPSVPALRRQLFEIRGLLRGRIAGWHSAGLMNHENQQLLRDCLRAARFASDMLGELANDFKELPEGSQTLKAFTGETNTLVTPAFDTDALATFQSGDIILVRGMHHNSAAIARIGDVDSQFSHVCIVHVDRDGKQWAVESLIEEGAVINPLGYTLNHSNGRAILFRHPDAALAAKASKIAYDHVRLSYGALKRRILYDFTMRLDGRRELFCSKLIWFAYHRASKGGLKLPLFPTRFNMRNRDFIDRIGVKAVETYAPGDTEIDARFFLVAEWQDFRVTSRLRAQDLIMVKLFDWMETHGYTFRPDFLIRLISWFGRLSTHLSDDVKALLVSVVPKVPGNMSAKTIAAVAMLHKTAEPLLAEVRERELEQIARSGRPLHPRQVYEILEQIRQRSDGRIGYLVAPGA